jgi:hypothetical protein
VPTEDALALSRAQTRECLMRSLYRANVRQQAVARRRTLVRYIAKIVRWSLGIAFTVFSLLWAAVKLDVVPQWRIVTEDRLKALELSTKASSISTQPVDRGVASSPAALDIPAQQAPIDLKIETQLNSVRP